MGKKVEIGGYGKPAKLGPIRFLRKRLIEIWLAEDWPDL
jgi:hypothetical protein